MKILGIDPGYATIGYGVVEKINNNVRAIDVGVIVTPKEESFPVRLAMLNDNLKKIIEHHKPDCIAIEELFFNTNTTTAIKVAEARGVILLCSIMECGHIYEYTPLQVKSALTGNGRAEKKQVQFMVRAILKLKEIPKPDDAADALAVALTHAQSSDLAHRVLN